MKSNGIIKGVRRGGVVLALALLAACVPQTSRLSPVAAASPCGDPSYVRLQQQDPDSLSAREWQRLQTLDRECAAARAQASREPNAMTGTWHNGRHWLMGGIASAVMVAMMISMW